jgi:hypothetical protein
MQAKVINGPLSGDIQTFRGFLEENQTAYIRKGMFLVFERLHMLLYLNIIRKTAE